ncbi:hypothetical protein HHK36_004022 [Tetracentron sinense]|uniref:OCRE domain-containing protein n=1 Tax=Tetracentron sinense TaxID=13715 RepID=A0A834ZZ27_TETSI|nr:hypothetical protein HHK36_004022 [Tetracentron sinense]
MEEKAFNLKRPLPEDDDSNKPPMPKRARFPKGKKAKAGDEVASGSKAEEGPNEWKDPRFAAKERAKRRNQMAAELFREESGGILHDISAAEVNYEDNTNFVDDGIQIEPFNLEQEREEGYFDADGNFVEYVNENEIKDAWLDSVDIYSRFAGKGSEMTNTEDDIHDLSSEDIGKMKRRIANLLEPGETVLQALRRLKGSSNDKKEKMPAETKLLFDHLTEDSMKLMENGDYNVYHEKQEVFQREAGIKFVGLVSLAVDVCFLLIQLSSAVLQIEGYERLAHAREGTSRSAGNDNSDSGSGKDIFPNGVSSSPLPDTTLDPSNLNLSTAQISSSNGADTFDIFANDDENNTVNPSSDENSLDSGATLQPFPQPSSESLNLDSESGVMETDYVYDESSGYYYSSSLGYYYDPTSGLYCCATSGRWYSFNEQAGTYDEI